MKRSLLICAGWTVVAAACADHEGTGPVGREPVFTVLVSEPVAARPAVPAGPGTWLALADSVVYVSMPPGTVPTAVRVEIRNRRTGATYAGPATNGGFDPVPLPAVVGDTLAIVVIDAEGGRQEVVMAVASRRPPIVVRTDPPPKKTDVPLNVVIVVVFSEPIDSTTLDTTTIQLLRGESVVAGTVRPKQGNGLVAEFVPAALLQPSSEHRLIVTTDVADLAGDRLEDSVVTTFTTLAGGGNRIVFGSDRTPADIYAMNADGSGVVNLTNDPWSDWGAAWSPDGSQIAFVSDRAEPCLSLYVMNADGSGVRRVMGGSACDYAYSPSWSPDGSRIAFERWAGGSTSDIYVVNADGSGLVRLTSGEAFHETPAWSPDGSRIAFARYVGASQPDIYVMNADGTNATNLTNHAAFDGNPAWSPDGTRIAFATTRDGNTEVYVMNLDGSGLVNLTNNPARELGIAWSPDGSRLAFDSNRNGNLEIYVMNADGTGVVRLTTHPAYDESPAWARR